MDYNDFITGEARMFGSETIAEHCKRRVVAKRVLRAHGILFQNDAPLETLESMARFAKESDENNNGQQSGAV